MAQDGAFEDALDLLETAFQLDPLSTRYIGDQGHIYYWAERFDEGIEAMTRVLEKFPGDNWLLWMLGYLYSGQGDYEKAIEVYSSRSVGKTNWMLAYSLGMAGRTKEAEDILEYLLEKRSNQHVPAYMIASVCAGLGRMNDALIWLEQDYNDGGQGLFFQGLEHDVKFKALWESPEFQRLVDHIR